MATLIAANYQSESSTAYGFMSTWNIKLKNNTLYTLKCRYKWNKNGTGSSYPLACYLYEGTWSNHCGAGGCFTEAPTTYKTVMRTFTTNGSASSYTFAISNYANGQNNDGVAGGAILDVDWYELWEGDATTFSLTDAIAVSENKSATDFLNIGGTIDTTSSYYNKCTNHAYFSSLEPQNAIRSWMGYYYKTGQTTNYGDWVYTYNHYSSAYRSRSVYTYDVYSNGKLVHVGTSTQTEYATVTYAGWSYNWTTTNNSTRSRTVTYSWSDYSSSATQTETGGTRYLTLNEETHDGAGGKVFYTFPANGSGSKTFTIQSYNYWDGAYISHESMSGASVSCSGFTCSVSGSTLTITASHLGTTEKAYHSATIVTSKSGFITRSGYTRVAQEANTVTSSTPSYGSWSYNWVASGNSTRTRSVSYTDTYTSGSTANRTAANQTETGGARYIVLDSFSDGVTENGTHSFSAAGGSITARTVSHEYWGGTHITTNVITGVSTSCSGFTCSVSGSTVTITAASKGTTASDANSATISSTKSGFEPRYCGVCQQAANTYQDNALQITCNQTSIPWDGAQITLAAYVQRKYTSGSVTGFDYDVTSSADFYAGNQLTATDTKQKRTFKIYNNNFDSDLNWHFYAKYGSLTSQTITVVQSQRPIPTLAVNIYDAYASFYNPASSTTSFEIFVSDPYSVSEFSYDGSFEMLNNTYIDGWYRASLDFSVYDKILQPDECILVEIRLTNTLDGFGYIPNCEYYLDMGGDYQYQSASGYVHPESPNVIRYFLQIRNGRSFSSSSPNLLSIGDSSITVNGMSYTATRMEFLGSNDYLDLQGMNISLEMR